MSFRKTRCSLASISFLIAVCAFAKTDWHYVQLKDSQIRCEFPSPPKESAALLNHQPSKFFTSDFDGERFVVGYTPFPAQAAGPVKEMISKDPLGQGVRNLLNSTVVSFADGGQAKIVKSGFLIEKGFPEEQAILKNDKTALNLRLFLTPKRLFILIAISTPESARKFFNSVEFENTIND